MRNILIGVIGMAASSCAYGAVVTYTLSLNEGVNGQCAANRFAIYATVSQGDNFGLRLFELKLRSSDDGGANLTTYTNRSPTGTFDADPSDPDYDPDISYPTKFAGFGGVHIADQSNGTLAAFQDLVKGTNLVRVGGFGQRIGNMVDIRPTPARNPPDSTHPNRPVNYASYVGLANTDVAFGTSSGPLPLGSLRLATGVWSGDVLPSFDTQLGDTFRADVWRDSQLTNIDGATVHLQTYDYCTVIPEPICTAMLVGSLVFLRRGRRARV